MDGSGNLYGTTAGGGSPKTVSSYTTGTVFELVNNSGTYTEKILKDFMPGCGADGTFPGAGLTMDSSGNLYGTATSGGAEIFYGTVFVLALTLASCGGYTTNGQTNRGTASIAVTAQSGTLSHSTSVSVTVQ
jgi:hypothetical protein